MKYWVSFRAEARDDLEAALSYFSSFSIRNQHLFVFDFENRIEQLQDFPESHQKIHQDVRRTLLHRFSYAIYYRVHVQSETIEIIAIFDARRDPESWKGRLEYLSKSRED